MTQDTVSLGAIESFIAKRHKSLAFPQWLERRFEADTRRRRSHRLQANALHTCAFYNFAFFGDWLLVPDQMLLSLKLHMFFVTPWMLLVAALMSAKPTKWIRETAASTLPLVMSYQILTVYYHSHSPFAAHYQYFILMPILFATVIQRLPFPFAVAVCTAVVGCHALANGLGAHLPWQIAVMASIILAASGYTTLFSNFYLERDFRRAYLHRLRDQCRIVETEAESKHDALTDLANRHALNDRVAELWTEAGRQDFPIAAIMLDVDAFKAFNDMYGHPAGDECLRRVAARVTGELRNNRDMAVRFGGEEFLVLMPRTDLEAARGVAERVRAAVESLAIPHAGASKTGRVTVSLGVAVAPTSSRSADDLIKAADTELYAAKRNGRNQISPPIARHGSDADLGPCSGVAWVGG